MSIFLRSSVKSVSEKALMQSLDAIVVRFHAAEHALQPPVFADAFGNFCAGAVVAVKGEGDVLVELRAVGRKSRAKSIENFDGSAGGIFFRFQHERRHRTNERGLRYALGAVASEIARHFAAARRVADHDGVL
jgi:hypothetical protein